VDTGALTITPGRRTRPLTVTVLAVLWALSVPLYAIGGALVSWPARPGARMWTVTAGIALALVAAAMAYGMWQRRAWAHTAQLAIAGVGLFLCPFTLASIAVLVYMLRPGVKAQFAPATERAPTAASESETMFAGAVVGAVVLGVILSAALTFLARTARTLGGPAGILAPAAEKTALEQLRALAASQDAFRSVCNSGFGDLEGLRQPATVIPSYPADGPAFLRDPAFDRPERDGYRYELTVTDPIPPVEGCPTRRFRRYLYTASPMGPGRFLAVGADGVVRAAQGRPATATDPPAQ
jgi:hypothetical protein